MEPLPITDATRAAASLAAARRRSVSSQNSQLRDRFDEVMKWLNPPWDDQSRRVDPRPEQASAERSGIPKIHVDWSGQAVLRWSVLQVGAMPTFRFIPRYVPPPPPADPDMDPKEREYELKFNEIDRAEAEEQAEMMENQTREWLDHASAHRTLLWMAWAKEAFGKAICKTGWDDAARMPTLELLENPSLCYYAWTTRYGTRRLAWMVVADQMTPDEIAFRYGVSLPTTNNGVIDYATWSGMPETSDMDSRPENIEDNDHFAWVEEMWALQRDDATKEPKVVFDFIVGGRVLAHEEWPWSRIPFHVFESIHMATWTHGKSMAESVIPINQAYDDMLDRQHNIIDFESGPRYKGLNMGLSNEAMEVPAPGEILPLREGEDVLQIDTRVDFWPSQVHAEELRESLYFATGLTPIAWGMSPNAQTSGRALSAEWRAVELPLAARLIEMTPVLIEIVQNWWDFAEAYVAKAKAIAKGHRRVQVVWEPLDIRDQSERIMSVIQMYQADLMDPETALAQTGTEDVQEKIALIRKYLTDPVWNPLRYQQMLVLKQLALSIEQQEMQNAAMRGQMGGQGAQAGAPEEGPSAEDLAAEGEVAAGQAAQGPQGPVTEGMNQPGASPSLPLNVQTLSRTPLEGGVGNQIMVGLGGGQGPTPTTGAVPR